MIQPVESLEITVLVDNGTDSLSTNPEFVETEMAGAWRRGMKWLSGRCLCCAAHGLSCLITTRTPSSQHTLLFDTGPDKSIFERNVIRLGADMGGVDAMMLSHGHWDHAGAMPRALQMMTLANGGRRVPTYMHPDMFASRAVKANDGRLMPMEDIPSEHILAANGADLIIARNEQSVLSNTVFISGEIPRVTSFEKGMPGQHRLDAAGEWTPDELLVDERFVAVHFGEQGPVRLHGLFARRPDQCSHCQPVQVLLRPACRAVLWLQPARRENDRARGLELVAPGHDGRRQGALRRHRRLLPDRLHRRFEEDQCAGAGYAQRG